MSLVLLHTSPVHIPVFDGLRDRNHPGLALRHVVAEELLARAQAEGVAAVAEQVREAVRDAGADGDAVLCTCSTIGGIAETHGALRVDRPMAAAAVVSGPRIAVLATSASTVPPTEELLSEEAERAGRAAAVEITSTVVEGAWERFQSGDRDGYLDLVAEAVDAVAAQADAVVLAQASMADAAARARSAASAGVPVLSSPALGLRAAAEAVGS